MLIAFHSCTCLITLSLLDPWLNFYSMFIPIYLTIFAFICSNGGWGWPFSHFSYVAIFPVIFLGCSFFVCLFCFVLFCFVFGQMHWSHYTSVFDSCPTWNGLPTIYSIKSYTWHKTCIFLHLIYTWGYFLIYSFILS